MTDSYGAAFLILLGLFFLGGVISFAKQGMPKSVIAMLAVFSAISLAAGILRWK